MDIKAALGNYASVRKEYYEAVFVAVYDYLDGTGPITTYKNAIRLAMTNAFLPAAEIGYEAGGGTLPMDEDTLAWLSDMQSAELGYIDSLFISLRDIRKSEDVQKVQVAQARAQGYTQTLDMIYNHAKISGANKNVMLTFVGDDGKESCEDCRRYKNKRRRAKWWIENDAIPPNHNFECKGYNCRHTLVDDNGTVWTL